MVPGGLPSILTPETSELITDENRDRILREWGVYYDLDKKFLLEKTPTIIVMSRFLQALFPESRFAFIVRHPIAAALATQKWSQTSAVELLLHWHVTHKILLDDVKHLKRYVIFRYEDFVQSPRFYTDAIFDMLGVDKFEPKEAVQNHNAKYFTTWLEQHKTEQEIFAARFPEVIEFFSKTGYSLSEPFDTGLSGKSFIATSQQA